LNFLIAAVDTDRTFRYD